MPITTQQIIGLQRAEFDKAQWLNLCSFLILFAIAALAGASVLFTNQTVTYFAGVIAAILVLAWAWVNYRLRYCRSHAERGRRATLLLEGLGGPISPGELRDIAASFTVSREEGAKKEDKNFYATKREPGDERLAEMLEESAFWTQHLMEASAAQTWVLFVGFLVLGFTLLFALPPFAGGQQMQDAVRILCAFLPFLLSWEVLGAAVEYGAAARSVAGISKRITAIRNSGFPRVDFLLLLGDYNAAVQSAPIVAPGAYQLNKARLNQLWRERSV